MSDPTSTHVPDDGRQPPSHTPAGKFARGNKLGRGNLMAGKVAKLRATLLRTVTKDDFREVVEKLMENAKAGDVTSIKELLSRLLGPYEAIDVTTRLDALELKIDQMTQQRGRT